MTTSSAASTATSAPSSKSRANPQGGVYPVGTIIQLVPTEAMVKRRAGYSPSTGDWEFFSLRVSPEGTKIVKSGGAVKNFAGADCASCHSLAERKFDFVCGKDHGCAPLPLTDALIARIQRGDPRPKPSGSSRARRRRVAVVAGRCCQATGR